MYTQKRTSLYVYNLKSATTYYWTVSAGDVVSDMGIFSTADCQPRNIYCDGVTNMRDLGGWKTEDGRRVKQGLLYRSGQWEKPGASLVITDKGVATLQELGIVTEIDLRNEAVGKVTKSAIEIEILADENNYPIVFHCAIGTDRTGYVAFLINTLLGVEKEALYRDYLFSNFGNLGASRGLTPVKLEQ